MIKNVKGLAVSALALGLLAAPGPAGARTPRYYRSHTVAHGTMRGGAVGTIVRKPTMMNRNIRVRFDNGQNPLLEVPMNATIFRGSNKISEHDLHNGQRVRVWARRGKKGEAMQAWRIDVLR